MKFKELTLPSSFRNDNIVTIIFCLLMLLTGCSDFQFAEEDSGKTTDEKRSSESDDNKRKNAEADEKIHSWNPNKGYWKN